MQKDKDKLMMILQKLLIIKLIVVENVVKFIHIAYKR